MIISLLLFNTISFAVYLTGAFIFLSAGLLFLDSWILDKEKKTPLIRGIGFFILALVYALYASSINNPGILLALQIIKIFSLSFILLSLIKEPILHKPKNKLNIFIIPILLPILNFALIPLSAVLLLIISLWYIRRSTEGLDKQLMPAGIAFLLISISELIKTSFFWADTSNVFFSKILAEFSIIWILHNLFLLIGIIILGLWVWGYIRFRLQIQLFVTILASILVIFLTTTMFLSFLLLKNLENDALSHLKTDANVFQYSLDRLQLESLSHGRAIAVDTGLKKAIIEEDQESLYKITSDTLISQNLSSLIVATYSGDVLMRAENRESIGDNISEDILFNSAKSNQQLSTILINNQKINPEVFIKSAVPVKNSDSNKVSGVILTGFTIDDAFLDGIKDITGLEATVFAKNKRIATTIIASDGKSRYTGTLETNEDVLKDVLKDGKTFVGKTDILSEPYYAAYIPLKTLGNKNIGMLFIGKPQTSLLLAAQKSIDLTFLGSIILMIAAIIPAFFLSRYIKEHLEA